MGRRVEGEDSVGSGGPDSGGRRGDGQDFHLDVLSGRLSRVGQPFAWAEPSYRNDIIVTPKRRDEILSEAQLIRRAGDGDARAVRALYERYSPRVYAVVRRIAANDDLAQDYAQEAWIRAMRALPTFRGDSRFSTWLHRIAVNAALQAVRRAGTRTRREAPMPEAVPVGPGVRDSLLQRRLEDALDRLPQGMRQVIILHDVEGYTHEEIGEMLGIASGTSKSQLFKARAKMRSLLGSIDQQDGEQGAEAWSV